jgi:hypothetical protein
LQPVAQSVEKALRPGADHIALATSLWASLGDTASARIVAKDFRVQEDKLRGLQMRPAEVLRRAPWLAARHPKNISCKMCAPTARICSDTLLQNILVSAPSRGMARVLALLLCLLVCPCLFVAPQACLYCSPLLLSADSDHAGGAARSHAVRVVRAEVVRAGPALRLQPGTRVGSGRDCIRGGWLTWWSSPEDVLPSMLNVICHTYISARFRTCATCTYRTHVAVAHICSRWVAGGLGCALLQAATQHPRRGVSLLAH